MLKRMARKHFKKWGGILVFYMVYDPREKEPNVLSNMIHPDIAKDEELIGLLKKASDKVREFYRDNPGLLEEALESVSHE